MSSPSVLPGAVTPPTPVGYSLTDLPPGERTGTIVIGRRTLFVGAAGIAVIAAILGALVVAIVLRSAEPSAIVAPSASLPPAMVPVEITTAPVVTHGEPAPPPGGPATPGAQAPASVTAGSGVTASPVEVNTGSPIFSDSPLALADPLPASRSAPPPAAPAGGSAGSALDRGQTPIASAEPRTDATGDAPPSPTAHSTTPAVGHPPMRRGDRGVGGSRSGVTRSLGPGQPVRIGGPSTADPAILDAYRRQDFVQAARLATAAGRSSLAAKIEQFAADYRLSLRAPRGSCGAITALERAIERDREIDPTAPYGARLRDELVRCYLDASVSTMGRDPQGACGMVRRAIMQQPGSARAQELALQCEQRAQRVLQEAAAAERSDAVRARALYQQVLLLVPNHTPTYRRARERLDALGRRRPVDEDE
jgi:hypothetical protein